MTLVPSSRAYFRVRVSALDACFALLSPLLALWVRDAPVLSAEYSYSLYPYWACCTIFSLLAFSIFRLKHKGLRYFSVDDIFDIAKSVVLAESLTAAVLFSFTRLEGIPRSTLFIHALILATALVTARTIAHFEHAPKGTIRHPSKTKYVVVIGSNYLSSAFIKWLETNEIEPKQVMAILDDRKEVMGQKISGVQVLGNPLRLKQTVEEFSVHGVKIDEVIVSNDEKRLAKPVLAELQIICRQREIELTFLPQLFHSTFRQVADPNNERAELQQAPTFRISSYFEVKRVLDFVFALLFTVLLSPVFICVSVLVALDVGTPLVFWQRRLGQGGRGFQIYKFRTMQSPFDRLGETLPEKRRLSAIGHLLRKTGLDELPQLLNVLVGDMSLVGPRPLLPEDQPADPTTRLMVRPGITGWAQVNGGKQITNDEKGDLDEWYIRNVSPWLDLRILLLTCRYVFVRSRANVSPSTNAKSGVGKKTLDGKAA
jgi:lipopolysaccharide/colanic/teichoic acid biosynthesis glycosyltransferase